MPQLKRYGFACSDEELTSTFLVGTAETDVCSEPEADVDHAKAQAYRALSILLIVLALAVVVWTLKH